MSEDYAVHTVVQLRKKLKARGLETKGRKAELVNRLEANDASQEVAEPKAGSKRKKGGGPSAGAKKAKVVKKGTVSIKPEDLPEDLPEDASPGGLDDDTVPMEDVEMAEEEDATVNMEDFAKEEEEEDDDPLSLSTLFEGGDGHVWEEILAPVIRRQPMVDVFLGKSRAAGIVPVRELTFQALKPNPPAAWKVVVFGQGPYKRMESATGISFFDNAFDSWDDSLFGRTLSMRTIMKNALIWKHAIPRDSNVAKLRMLLKKHKVVQPPQWFQSMLTQGLLLISAALTENCDDGMTTSAHTAFWRPVVHAIIDAIMQAKENTDEEEHTGVVFAWWGTHAKSLRSYVDKIASKYPSVPVQHVTHYNPAARKNEFNLGNHFQDINDVLEGMQMSPINWLPSEGWDAEIKDQTRQGDVARMRDFITETQNLHKVYLDRLQGVGEETVKVMGTLEGVRELPLVSFAQTMKQVYKNPVTQSHVKRAIQFANNLKSTGDLSKDEASAIHVYTSGSSFYRDLNAALRDPKRAKVNQYFLYIRLFLSALSHLAPCTTALSLWRGVAADLTKQYKPSSTIVWWGVSSCSSERRVAQGFLGPSGKRMLFEMHSSTAAPIKRFSAFSGEEEYIIAPGAQLKVVSATTDKTGLCHVIMEEVPGGNLIR
mmetsp:Transcript_13296/g.52989  ORF Transcript_13296/g.52989 Transcript_13296/m.52989 type:complete len:654 (-) Transcript_13296:35-1996(-)